MPDARDTPHTVILADGDYPHGKVAAALLSRAQRVVCCDGAAAGFVSRGGVPYAIVGDCDSIGTQLHTRFAAIIHRDPDQETNDLTKAVRYCVGKGMRDITILGATGRREDHTLANISLLVDYALDADVRMVTDTGAFDPILTDAQFESYEGQQVSVFTLSPQTLITTIGLCYPLDRASLTRWWCGTLNQSEGDRFGFASTGPAIVYRQFRESDW